MINQSPSERQSVERQKPAPSQPKMITRDQVSTWYVGSAGYDPDFLDVRVGLPSLSRQQQRDAVLLQDGSYELKYVHFSVVMSKSRRLAFFTAVNVNGQELKQLRRRGDKWYYDPRIDREYQCGPELYDNNDFDYGHLVRRLDPVWGPRAAQANEDTFHLTNCAPQHKNLNRKKWQALENYILNNADCHDLKVSVFTGPVFSPDDMLYRGKFRIPAEFWKVVIMVKDDGKPSATAYVQTQKDLLQGMRGFVYGKYYTYQVPIVHIETLTDLNFGALRDHDPLAGIRGVAAHLIRGPRDIRL